jgi:tricorn protease
VPAAGGDVERLPLGWAAYLDIDPTTGRYAFNRRTREHATWKRYRGGTAADIWVGDPDLSDYTCVTSFAGKDAFPMWHDGRIWFLSDQGGTANLWSMAPDGSDRQQHTEETVWDLRWPSMSPDGRIICVRGADLQVLDPATGERRQLDVDIPSDRVLTRVRYPDPERYITSVDLAPDADRLLVTARGELFSVPVEKGVTLRLSGGSGARERGARFGPEGKRITYITDASGEEAIQTLDAWGRGEPTVVVPAGESGWHVPPAWSPDGAWIAYADQTFTLYVVPAGGGDPVRVAQAPQEEIREYVWSPDGRWLAYTSVDRQDFSTVFLFDTTTGERHAVTGPTTSDHSPAWDPEGRYLAFLGDRTMNPFVGWRDYATVELRTTRPYLVLLREDVENPFALLAGLPDRPAKRRRDRDRSDRKGKDDDEPEDRKHEPVAIDLDGLGERIVEVPVDVGLYRNLQMTKDHLFYLSRPLQGRAERRGRDDPSSTLVTFDLEKQKAKDFLDGVADYQLAARADKVAILRKRGQIHVVGAGEPPGDKLGKQAVDLSSIVIELDPREEWRQIYQEAWRNMRDFHWEPGLSGLDWQSVRDQYATLLDRVATRSELRDLLGELIGELATSHTYVWGGDRGVDVPEVGTGLLGAELVREGLAYRVERIFRGDPADREPSPLLAPETRVQEGEYLQAVDNRSFPPDRPYHAALAGLAGKDVLLTVSDQPEGGTVRQVVVRALGSDRGLRYADRVRRNRELVAARTDGKIGYIHVPDMGSRGLIEFDTWFYPQLHLEGLVVDIRWNGGGNVSQLLLERFRRRVVSWDRSRGGGVSSYPARCLRGPFVVLTNQFAGSDGDIFPMAVQLEGLAPVIGMRSWGGVVGIRGDKPLVDGGALTQPEYAWWDTEQGWGLENRGVVPDVEVENLPQELAQGIDRQLERGIEEVLRLRATHPPATPSFGPPPVKTRDAFENELQEQD